MDPRSADASARRGRGTRRSAHWSADGPRLPAPSLGRGVAPPLGPAASISHHAPLAPAPLGGPRRCAARASTGMRRPGRWGRTGLSRYRPWRASAMTDRRGDIPACRALSQASAARCRPRPAPHAARPGPSSVTGVPDESRAVEVTTNPAVPIGSKNQPCNDFRCGACSLTCPVL